MSDQPQDAPVDDLTAAMRAAWENMLGMATAQGFTRGQIVRLTLGTVDVMVATTVDALWPDADVPDGEHIDHGVMETTMEALHGARAALVAEDAFQESEEEGGDTPV